MGLTMKKFLKYLLVFALPVVGCSIGTEMLLRSIPNVYSYKCDYLDAHSDSIETLILGTSHSFYGVNPDYFRSRCFNAALVSQTLDFDYQILRKYSDHFAKLKCIVVPISYFSLFETLANSVEAGRIKNYSIYYHIYTSWRLSDNSEFLGTKFDLSLKRIYIYHTSGKTELRCSPSGWGLGYLSKRSKNLNSSGKRAATGHTMESRALYSENIRSLLSIIHFAEKKGIRVYFFTPPAFDTYTSRLNGAQLQIMLNTMNGLDRRYEHCFYHNFLTDSSFVAHDFYDADHLNEIGAEKLSRKLDSLITNCE